MDMCTLVSIQASRYTHTPASTPHGIIMCAYTTEAVYVHAYINTHTLTRACTHTRTPQQATACLSFRHKLLNISHSATNCLHIHVAQSTATFYPASQSIPNCSLAAPCLALPRLLLIPAWRVYHSHAELHIKSHKLFTSRVWSWWFPVSAKKLPPALNSATSC